MSLDRLDPPRGRDLATATRESEERLRTVFATLAEGLIVLDRSGRIVEANRSAERILGFDRGGLLGRSPSDPDWIQLREDGTPYGAADCPSLSSLESGQASSDVIVGVSRPDGGTAWLLLNSVPVLAKDGSVTGVVTSFLDVTERRRAEAALAVSEERFRLIIENISDVVTVVGEDGTIRYESPNALAAFGWRPEERAGHDALSFIHPGDLPEIAPLLSEVAAEPGLVRRASFRHRRGDGSWGASEAIATNMLDRPGVEGIVVVSRDVTAERAQAELLERYRLLAEHARDGLFFLSAGGRILDVNQAAVDGYGYTREELLSMHVSKLRAEAERGTLAVQLAAAAAAAAGTLYETVHRRKDGSTFPVEISLHGADVGGEHVLVGIVRDISARRRNEAAVRESEERFRTAFEDAAIGMALTDPDGHFVRVNRALCGIARRGEEELLGLGVQDITHPDDLEANLALARRLFAGEIESYQMEKRYVDRDGQTLWTRVNATAVRDDQGHPVYGLAQVEDISSRKQAEAERDGLLEQLAAQNERLQELDRRKDELVAVISHELRTPLTSMIGYLDAVLEEEAEAIGSEQREFVEGARRNADRLQRLVEDLLLITRLEEGRAELSLEEVDLAEIAEEAVLTLRSRAQDAGVGISIGILARPAVNADPARIVQVVAHLLANGVASTPPGGSVTVTVSEIPDAAVVEIADTGRGIPPDELEHLFERFFRTSEARQHALAGAGIGLAISKSIVEAHHGTISVSSAVGTGTVFRVTLPLAS